MDKLNFGEFLGFFGIECSNVLGLGGAFYAALLGISALSKEEKEHTAEFLLTHPLRRTRIITEKLLAVVAQLVILNLTVIALSSLAMVTIQVSVDAATLALLYLAYFFMQLQIAAITFGISAFLRRGDLGIGLGLATMFYFLNIVANLLEETKLLKYLTPLVIPTALTSSAMVPSPWNIWPAGLYWACWASELPMFHTTERTLPSHRNAP